MASPVITPIEGITDAGSTRWQVGASSLSETVTQLSHIWGHARPTSVVASRRRA